MKNPSVNRAALEILRAGHAFGYDDSRKVRTIFEWVVRHIGYVKDPPGKELLRPAEVLLEVRAGDCDDLNGVLLPSLLGTIGYPCRLVTISTNADAPDEFSHIYAECGVNGRWIPLDAARRGASWMKPAGRHFRKRIWSLQDDAYSDVQGLAGYVPSRRAIRSGRRRNVNGLGVFNWGALTNLINVGTTSAANLIAATKGGVPAFIPQASGGGAAPQSSTDYTPFIFGAAAIGAVLLLRGNR